VSWIVGFVAGYLACLVVVVAWALRQRRDA